MSSTLVECGRAVSCSMGFYAEAEKAIAQLSAPATLTKVEDIKEIMAYKILATPALVINGEVKWQVASQTPPR